MSVRPRGHLLPTLILALGALAARHGAGGREGRGDGGAVSRSSLEKVGCWPQSFVPPGAVHREVRPCTHGSRWAVGGGSLGCAMPAWHKMLVMGSGEAATGTYALPSRLHHLSLPPPLSPLPAASLWGHLPSLSLFLQFYHLCLVSGQRGFPASPSGSALHLSGSPSPLTWSLSWLAWALAKVLASRDGSPCRAHMEGQTWEQGTQGAGLSRALRLGGGSVVYGPGVPTAVHGPLPAFPGSQWNLS